MALPKQYKEVSMKTADDLRTIAHSLQLQDLSQLSLPEIDAAVDAVARMVPAGNVPGVILNGLARLPQRHTPSKTAKRDVNLLFKGVEKALDKAVYGAFFAGPAAIIWGYQNLLKLAGKEPEASFPEGVWQFYADYALREDTARHANETHGFDTLLAHHQIELHPVDRITAWVMAAVQCLHQYEAMLENEWRERIYTYLLAEVTADLPDAQKYTRLYRQWQKQRPYGRDQDAGSYDYPTYRRRRFDRFLTMAMAELDSTRRRQWADHVALAKNDLPAYRRQLSILAYLKPGPYGEERVPVPLEEAHIGVIYRGRYYLLPACQPGTAKPAAVETIRDQVVAITSQLTGKSAVSLSKLARLRRANLAELRRRLNPTLKQGLNRLQTAPILINSDSRPSHLPLPEIRQAERGIGDHALTLFDTGKTMVFDQSHIFFDGTWGAALAEIMTGEALSWAVYLNTLPPPSGSSAIVKPVPFPLEATELRRIERLPQITPEVSVETEQVKLRPILILRNLFKQRNDLITLTVNDLLILYRAIHALTYRPAPELLAEVERVAQNSKMKTAVDQTLKALNPGNQLNPAILIPVDASRHAPRNRLYPLVFEAPLNDLDFLELHARTMQALTAYKQEKSERETAYEEFDAAQRTYLATLAGFGAVLSKAKKIAIEGESASVGAIKMLANMPAPLQHLLDNVPNRFAVLNDLIKGREVFSNVGAVAPSSSLTRFHTAKDDNENKTLAWGVITDARGVMHISLRDFRPHVGALIAAGQRRLATRLAQHYLDTYATGLNTYIGELQRITASSRETRLVTGEKI